MNQLTLPLSRRTDPQTSVDAAARVPRFISSHEGRIVEALRGAPLGRTAKQIAKYTGLTDVQVCRRLSGMYERKLVYRIEISPRKFIARDGSAVWWLA